MGMQHDHAWTCSVDMHRVHAARACKKGMQHGHAPWACVMDMQQGHVATLSFIEGELCETEDSVSMYELLQDSRYGWALKLGGRSSSRGGRRGTIR
jgi:hypothetical protein